MTDFEVNSQPDLNWWQRIQDLLAGIIGANISFFSPSGSYFSYPSLITASCKDLTLRSESQQTSELNCLAQAFQVSSYQNQNSYHCFHTLHYFSIKFPLKDDLTGEVIVGPVLIGKRESENFYRDLCKRFKIDSGNFCDRIREVRVFSYTGIQTVIEFLREMTEYLARLSAQRKRLEELIPGFSVEFAKSDLLFSSLKLDHMANYLLDIALRLVEGDSGSVLLLSEDARNFRVKTFRGIRADIVRDANIPLTQGGIASRVALSKKSLLLNRDLKDKSLGSQLKRPEIQSSMVIPILCEEKTLGVFCVNAASSNERFNSENLALMDKLGKLAGLALVPSAFPKSTLDSPEQ